MSRGCAPLCARLRSSAINEPPVFDGPYLKDANDSAPLRWAMRQMRQVMRTPPLARYVREELQGVDTGVSAVPQLAHGPALASLGQAFQAAGCATHSGRAVEPLRTQREAAVRPCGPAEVTDCTGLNTQELVPGAAVHSDTQLDDAVRCGPRQFRGQELGGCDKTELPVNHLAGTCRLASSISEGVADLRLRVHGVSGLRIADASVMPRPPSGNTHATCMMIGERAAAFILEEFGPDDKGHAQPMDGRAARATPSREANSQAGAPPTGSVAASR